MRDRVFVGTGGGASAVDTKTRRVWFYQDFAAASGPGLTLTGNSNGSGGAAWDSAKIVAPSAVAVTTAGKRMYTGAVRLFSSAVSVSSHSVASVTLSAAPNSGWGTIRIWYLYDVAFANAPDTMQDAPKFARYERLEMLNATYLDENENLSDLVSVSTARTNLGLEGYATIKIKSDATVAPTTADDTGSGYTAGSMWLDVTNDRAYVCLDATSTAAVWKETTMAQRLQIDEYFTFTVNTHLASTGAATDADAVPTYRVYEDETGTAILTGSMAKLDDTNTVGFYSEQLQLTAANGFEEGKSYNVYISAAVSSVTGTTKRSFQM